MGRLVVEDVVFKGGEMTPLVGGERVRLLPLDVAVVEVLLLSRFLFGLRLDPKEAPNCLNREFMRTSSFAARLGRTTWLSKVTAVRTWVGMAKYCN